MFSPTFCGVDFCEKPRYIGKGITTPGNVASQKLLEKLGLTLKDTVQLPDSEETLLLYEFVYTSS